MKVKEITISKRMKIGLPNFSNIDIGLDMKFELGENEEVDWNKCWDTVNQQMGIQSKGIDPSWIITKSYNNFFKTIIKSKKEVK